MIKHLFPTFLASAADYDAAVHYWKDLWNQVDPGAREGFRWREPWLTSGRSDLFDGNPIFSAVSDDLRKGLRVIQHAPTTSDSVEFVSWRDTFGGSRADPDTIFELVISCALSDPAVTLARQLISAWVAAPEPSIVYSWSTSLVLPDFRSVRAVPA